MPRRLTIPAPEPPTTISEWEQFWTSHLAVRAQRDAALEEVDHLRDHLATTARLAAITQSRFEAALRALEEILDADDLADPRVTAAARTLLAEEYHR